MRIASCSWLAIFPLVLGCSDLLGADFERSGKGTALDAAARTSDGSATDRDGSRSPRPPGSGGSAGGGAPPPPPGSMIASNEGTFGPLPTNGSPIDAAGVTFDADAECVAGSKMGDCESKAQAVGPGVCVCRATSYVLDNVRVKGTLALALLAKDTITLKGLLDVAAEGRIGGPGSEPATASPGPGDFEHGNEALTPLRGGEKGEGVVPLFNTPTGGGGGGALQMSAGASITIGATARLQAGGGGGAGGFPASGGSGGAMLIEAPSVRIEGELLANGGGGSGDSNQQSPNEDGQDARAAGRNAAYGGTGAQCGGRGGSGGTRELAPEDGTEGCSNVSAGGPGGTVGRIRINTKKSGYVAASGAYVSPAPTFGTITLR